MREIVALKAAALAVGILVSAAQGQVVLDSLWIGRFVRDLVYNYRYGYVIGVSEGANVVFSINCAAGTMPHVIFVYRPLHVAFNVTDNRIYCSHGNGADDTVLVAHGTDLHPYKAIPVYGAWRLLWDSVSNRVYAACGIENDVAVIDCRTDSVVGRIRVGEGPEGLELNTRHRKLYVRNWDSESVSIIDLETGQVTKTVPVGSVPKDGRYCWSADKYYLAMEASELVVIDGAGDSIVRRIDFPAGMSARTLALVASHDLLMVGTASTSSDSVLVFDVWTDSLVASHSLAGALPEVMVWSSGSDLTYCAGWHNRLRVLAGDGSRVVCELAVGDVPSVMVAAPEYRRVYVGHSNGYYVYVVKDTLSGLAEDLAFTAPPVGLKASPNPFRRSVTIETSGVQPGDRQARHRGRGLVYTPDGRLVTALELSRTSGEKRAAWAWNGTDFSGREVGAGVYFVVLQGSGTCCTSVTKPE